MPSPKKTHKKTPKKKLPCYKEGDRVYYQNSIHKVNKVNNNGNGNYSYDLVDENDDFNGTAFALHMEEGYNIGGNIGVPAVLLTRVHASPKKTDSGGGNRKTKRKLNKRKSKKNKKTLSHN
jgi:hypothetical protein